MPTFVDQQPNSSQLTCCIGHMTYCAVLYKTIVHKSNIGGVMARYFFNVVESAVLNPDFAGYRSVRIEVTDNQSESHYPVYEANALLPAEFMDDFIKIFDLKESDLMPSITWNCKKG